LLVTNSLAPMETNWSITTEFAGLHWSSEALDTRDKLAQLEESYAYMIKLDQKFLSKHISLYLCGSNSLSESTQRNLDVAVLTRLYYVGVPSIRNSAWINKLWLPLVKEPWGDWKGRPTLNKPSPLLIVSSSSTVPKVEQIIDAQSEFDYYADRLQRRYERLAK
jgi:hypothetical protein